MVIHSLLDGPSAAGAYRFSVRPGEVTEMDVEATIFAREDIAHIGLAPLTSMFLFDAKDRAQHDDFRLGVHDSDGLAMWNGSDERLWRPLHAPRLLQISAFSDTGPRGFGLIQRERRFTEYEDIAASYHRRPSAWVEPIGDWGRGHVVLVEIPSSEEIHDNIVAYWRPVDPIAAGSEILLTYRLSWGWDVPDLNGLLRVARTLTGAGPNGRRRFVVDFAGHGRAGGPRLGGPARRAVQPGGHVRPRDIGERRDQRSAPAFRSRPRGRRRGRDAAGTALRRAPDRRDLGLPMEQLTVAPPLTDAAAPLPPPAPLEMPAQRLSSYDHARPRLTERASVNFARAGLALAAALLSILLIHQMWLVLSVGELTGVERVMLGLFVINITWIAFGALSPLMGFFLGRRQPADPRRPADPSGPRS